MCEPVYSWSHNEEQYFGDFATIEDALDAAEDEGHEEVVWVGECKPPTQPEVWWNAEDWLEHVSCQDEYGGEHAEDWDGSTKEQREELETEVRKVMAMWLDRHKLRPSFWNIKRAKRYVKEESGWTVS